MAVLRYKDPLTGEWHPAALDQNTADGRYVRDIGDTMTGPLVLPGAPTQDLHAATKAYVDGQGFFNVTAVESTSVSWNDATTRGVHPKLMHGTENLNGPGDTLYYYVTNYWYAGLNITQLAVSYTGERIAIRSRYSGTWSSWKTFARMGDVVDKIGDTMSGTLINTNSLGFEVQNATDPRIRFHKPGVDYECIGIGSNGRMQIRTGDWVSLTPLQAGAPSLADDLTPKSYVDNRPSVFSDALPADYTLPASGTFYDLVSRTFTGPCVVMISARVNYWAASFQGDANLYARLSLSGSQTGTYTTRTRGVAQSIGNNVGVAIPVSKTLTLSAGQTVTVDLQCYTSSLTTAWYAQSGNYTSMESLVIKTG